MIGDVLKEAAAKINEYLDAPENRGAYSGATRDKIVKLVNSMNNIRRDLSPPPPNQDNRTMQDDSILNRPTP